MRILRLFILAMAVGGVYSAQYLLENGIPIAFFTLPIFLPLTGQVPAPLGFRFWTAQNLFLTAQILAIIAILLFAGVAPLWRGDYRRIYRPQPSVPTGTDTRSLAHLIPAPLAQPNRLWLTSIFAAFVALLLVVFSTVPASTSPPGESHSASLIELLIGLALVIALLTFLAGATLKQSRRARPAYRRADALPIRPYRGWPWLLLVLLTIGATLIYLNQSLPYLLDPISLLQAQSIALLINAENTPLLPLTAIERALHWPAVALAQWTGDFLRAGMWRALIAALAGVVTLWLLACELFRRTPTLGIYDEILEDDGTFPALVTAASYPALLAFVHYARIPFALESVGLGLLTLWALIAGARKRNLVLISSSGLCTGLLVAYGGVGLAWIIIVLYAWLGIILFHKPWIVGRRAHVQKARAGPKDSRQDTRQEETQVQVETGLGKGAPAWWGWGAVLTAALTLVPRAQQIIAHDNWRQGFTSLLHSSFDWSNSHPAGIAQAPLTGTFTVWPLGLNLLENGDLGINLSDIMGIGAQAIALPSAIGGSLLGPLLLLSIGLALINVDHLLGWILTGWLTFSVVLFFWLDSWSAMGHGWYALTLPAQALAIAFALDRIRSTLLQNLGSWAMQATIYACAGLIIAAAARGVVGYVEHAALQRTPETELARVLPLLHSSANWRIVTADESVGQLVGPKAHTLLDIYQVEEPPLLHAGNWPPRIVPGEILLIDAQESEILTRLQEDFGIGELEIVRNLRSDPILFIYRAPQ